MKDGKSGRMKKYIHEIKINFDKQEKLNDVDINRMCDEICRKETTYLNPAYISRQQVSNLFDYSIVSIHIQYNSDQSNYLVHMESCITKAKYIELLLSII